MCYDYPMLGSIRGKTILKKDRFLIIEASGVGYKVNAPNWVLDSVTDGVDLFLFLYTHVREDSLQLYGFTKEEDLEMFEKLLGVSGIGPKGAISVLNITGVDNLEHAIAQNDLNYLTKVSGVGKKTAEKIILELKDKVTSKEKRENLKEELDALEALKALGYSPQEARQALAKTRSSSTNEKIKEALKILNQK